ncbi:MULTISPECIES: sensor histidine kinase [Streptomyces]|uniref:sensor histidine kinase n=1 Tax=Streptomyces galilaeus TaxID=33899 RepID=UPI0038F65EE8
MRTASPRGCARGAAVGVLLVLSVVDLEVASEEGYSVWPPAAVLVTGLAAVLWPPHRRPAWLTPQRRTAVPALLSVLYSVMTYVLDEETPFGPGETVVLLCLLHVAVRHCPPRWAVACGALNAGALLLSPVRYFHTLWTVDAAALDLAAVILIGLTAGAAAYRRSLDYRRNVTIADTRREERLAIAADLHDFVAHHVTGILVQTQMARMMATTAPTPTSTTTSMPPGLDPVLAGIERAATEALASMRRTVGVLREAGPDADRRPVGDLAGIADLTEAFTTPSPTLTVDAPDDLPHEVQAAAFRVVQESLTNVRRHAADATTVTVAVRHDAGRLDVTVTDDGRGGTQLPTEAHGGGFGLVGLTERVTALGGTLDTGPRPASPGWRVRASLPTNGRARRG